MNHLDKIFRNERIELHGKAFHNCTFENCELVFDGDRPPTFKDNRFVDAVFVFTGAATRTLYLLSNIYHAGEGGKEVVEKTFAAPAPDPADIFDHTYASLPRDLERQKREYLDFAARVGQGAWFA